MEALEIEGPMTEWNDDRLDEPNGRMKEGFARVDREVKEGFAKVDDRFRYTDERMEAGFERIDGRLDRIFHVSIVAAAGVVGTLLANGIWG
jgi:hypothetical protein